MIPSVTYSELLGYTSIACWLGAQFPQVVENWKRKSCEGLALPFLANWFLGDLSNLIGCVLTHQLPFQKYLATYFVFVDLTLVTQYYYYTGFTKSLPSYHARSTSVSRTRRVSNAAEAARYRALSAVAANVAATAALAAHHDEIEHRHKWHRHTTDQTHSDVRARGFHETADEDVDEGALALLADSFHSERGDPRRKRISWSVERPRTRSGSLGHPPAISPMTPHYPTSATDAAADPAGRGRALDRDLEEDLEIQQEVASHKRQTSRASRRGSAMVFLSVWALFSIGNLAANRHSAAIQPLQSTGTVLAAQKYGAPDPMPHFNISIPITDVREYQDFSSRSGELESLYVLSTDEFDERFIGRIFAWLCTTLYLTSRLPQIWKNFVRKSVEGLSMYLFVFAFLGNIFYVASILTSPSMSLPPEERLAFLKETFPYLLGSAGTLIFDITIVAQSFIYRPRHRRNPTHSRLEEEAGLLTGDSMAANDSTALPRGRTSRIRGSN